MRKNYREERRISVHEQDIVRRWQISVERYVQRYMAVIEAYICEGTLTREFVGPRLRQRAVTEIVLQLVYNGMHLNSRFDWERFDTARLLEVACKNYIPEYGRRDFPDHDDCKMSRVLDVLTETTAADIEDFLVAEEMVGFYYEPVIEIVYGNQLFIEVYDYRAYQWMLHNTVRDAQELEANDERSPFYVR